jgi:two-component system response regulator DesR
MLQAAREPNGSRLEAEPVQLRAEEANTARRVVIVAGNSLIAEAIRGGFRKSSEFNLVGYADGIRTSARTIVTAQPSVVLVDDMERSERAVHLLTEIKAEDDEIALIVLSVQLDAEWLVRLFDAGAAAVISKAIHPAALATLVRETLNGHVFRAPPVNGDGVRTLEPTSATEDLPLTGREREILELVASGRTNADVARRLWITEQTVKFHLRNIYRKLDVANRTQASHLARTRGLVIHEAGLVERPPPAELMVAS